MDVVWIVTGSASIVAGVAGGLIGREYLSKLDERRNARRAGTMLGLDNQTRSGDPLQPPVRGGI